MCGPRMTPRTTPFNPYRDRWVEPRYVPMAIVELLIELEEQLEEEFPE